jgi:hypothetical protein
MTQYKDKIRRLREALKKSGIGILIIPSSDPHLVRSHHWRIIQRFTGFSGSAGTVVADSLLACGPIHDISSRPAFRLRI